MLLPLLLTLDMHPDLLLVRELDIDAVTTVTRRRKAESVLALVAILIVIPTKDVERLLSTWCLANFARRAEIGRRVALDRRRRMRVRDFGLLSARLDETALPRSCP